jgi:hypothetical protein
VEQHPAGLQEERAGALGLVGDDIEGLERTELVGAYLGKELSGPCGGVGLMRAAASGR